MSNFQIVHTPAGWHARWRGDNNEIVWTTEVYEDKVSAENAIFIITEPDVATDFALNGFTGIEVVEEA